MKILHALHGFPPELTGGTERTVEALSRAMQRQGHEVVVVAGTLERAPCERVVESEHDGLRVVRLHRDDAYFEDWHKARSPGVSRAFERLLARERPDVVHVHHWIRLTDDLVRLARAAGARTAVTLHDYWTALATPVRMWGDDAPHPPGDREPLPAAVRAEAFARHRRELSADVRAADVRLAPSAAHARGLAEMADGELGEIAVSPPPLLRVPERRAAPQGPRGRRLLYWGSIYPEKGVDHVLDALFSVGGGWTLDVLGEAHEPVYRESLRRRSELLPVTFHGRFEPGDLARIAADYAILPSTCHESYGLVLDEALCLGLPVIAADLPAYREHAQEGSCAWFAPNDPGSLAMLLCDEARLLALRVPEPPAVVTPERAAAELVARYVRPAS
jgi:glycosyltransferase involved in cell wall biosynthesis